MEEYRSKLLDAIDTVLLLEPYLRAIFMRTTYGFTEYIDTAGATLKNQLVFNKDFVLKTSHEELEFAVIHEILHIVLNHPYRMKKFAENYPESMREIVYEVYNMVADAVVNFLASEGLSTPRRIPQNLYKYADISKMTGIKIEELKKMSEEEIASKILEKIKVIGSKKPFERDIIDTPSDYEVEHQGVFDYLPPDEFYGTIKGILSDLKSAGLLPAGLLRYIDNIYFQQAPWFFLLKSELGAIIRLKTRKTIKRPSRRYPGFFGYELTKLPTVIALIDTSGSISDDELSNFLSHIYSILYEFKTPFKIFCWDGDVYEEITARYASDVIKIAKSRIKGGGGTVPDYALIRALQTRGDILIIFTDGDWAYSDETYHLLQKVLSRFKYCFMITSDKIPNLPTGFIVHKL